MIDLKLLREDPERFRAAWKLRGASVDVDEIADLDKRHRRVIAEVEAQRAEHNVANKRISKLSASEREAGIAVARELAAGLADKEVQLQKAADALSGALAAAPNLVHPLAPPGAGDEANRLLRTAGEVTGGDFDQLDHLDLGQRLGIIDVERAAKVSGSRFAFLKGAGAILEVGLIRMTLDLLGLEGFVPVIPPVLVREEAMYGTGFFPADQMQVYKTAEDDLYLAGTSEVPIASMHSGEVFEPGSLPLRYAGFSTCFRREAGTYGKDTKGLIRVHQFDKVEMFSFCEAEESESEHQLILSLEERIFASLGIPYRVVEICAGDLAAPNYRKYDIEAWLPGSKRWLEITSCSNDIDYQARRLGVRVRTGGHNHHVHTLNGTAVAIGRCIVALLENHQRQDGSVKVPAPLAAYTGFEKIDPPSEG